MTVESKTLTYLESTRWTNVVSKWGYNKSKWFASKSPVGGWSGGWIWFPASKGGYKVLAAFVSQRVKGGIDRRATHSYCVAQQPVPAPRHSILWYWTHASCASFAHRISSHIKMFGNPMHKKYMLIYTMFLAWRYTTSARWAYTVRIF